MLIAVTLHCTANDVAHCRETLSLTGYLQHLFNFAFSFNQFCHCLQQQCVYVIRNTDAVYEPGRRSSLTHTTNSHGEKTGDSVV